MDTSSIEFDGNVNKRDENRDGVRCRTQMASFTCDGVVRRNHPRQSSERFWFLFQLALQMDALEQYLKIEKMDPTEVSESSIKHKEEKHSQMNSHYKDVETNGKIFINDAKEVRSAFRSSVVKK